MMIVSSERNREPESIEMPRAKPIDRIVVVVRAEPPFAVGEPWRASVTYAMPNRAGSKDKQVLRDRVASDYPELDIFFSWYGILGGKSLAAEMLDPGDLLPEHREQFETAKAAEISRRGY